MSFYYIETHFLLCWSSGRIASWINIRITRCRTNAGPVNGILHPIREWSGQIGVIVPETVVECQPNVITVNWSAQIVFDGECVGVPIATFGDVAVRKYKMANAFRSKYSVWLTIGMENLRAINCWLIVYNWSIVLENHKVHAMEITVPDLCWLQKIENRLRIVEVAAVDVAA